MVLANTFYSITYSSVVVHAREEGLLFPALVLDMCSVMAVDAKYI